uniref:Putative secreted protein n=1 Tax=Amblyomma tuberculatum TaxID=48802 RepID=A0A6M2E211_9ACAR
MSRYLLPLVVIFAVAAVISAERRLPKFNFGPRPSRFRYDVNVQAGGRNPGNFEGKASVRGEYDVYQAKNGAKVVVGGGVDQDVARYHGKTFKGKPDASVGIGVEIPIGK